MRDQTCRRLYLAVTSAWAVTVAAGLIVLFRHAAQPGAPGMPAFCRPETAQVSYPPGSAHLVMFAHPRCPCTAASLNELARILARCGGRLHADVLFYRPEGSSESWAQTGLWRTAESLPGVRVKGDVGGSEAARFGVVTSGHILLFAPDGLRLFSGGITAARGHEGDNDGADAVVRLFTKAGPAPSVHAVFGCEVRKSGGRS